MAGFFGKQPFGEAARQLKRHALAAGQTSINVTYVRGFLDLYLNGVLLAEGTDYTATDGVTAVLASGATVGDVAHTVSWGTFASADHYTKADADAMHLVAKAGRKNLLINGCFRIWQRGVGPIGNGFLADRWNCYLYAGTSLSHKQYVLTDAERAVVGWRIKYAVHLYTGDTTSAVHALQPIEGVNTAAGEAVALSFYAWTDTGTCNIEGAQLQYFGSGGTPSATVTTAASLSQSSVGTTPVKITAVVTLPSISGKTLGTDGNDYLGLRLTKAAGHVGALRITKVQLEAGDKATDFERRSVGEELALCQRFYRHLVVSARGPAPGASNYFNTGYTYDMRGTPSASLVQAGGRSANLSSAGVGNLLSNSCRFEIVSNAAGDTYAIAETYALDAEL